MISSYKRELIGMIVNDRFTTRQRRLSLLALGADLERFYVRTHAGLEDVEHGAPYGWYRGTLQIQSMYVLH